MGLFLNQQDKRTHLQEKIAADLREKAKKNSLSTDPEPYDMEDSKYFEGTKQTTGLAWAWVLIFIMAVVAVILLMM